MASASSSRRISISKSFRIIACTPPGSYDPSVAIAASRAGRLGILDLEFASDHGAAIEAISRLTAQPAGELGIKLNGKNCNFVETVWRSMSSAISVVILTDTGRENLRSAVRLLHKQNIRIFVEVTSLAAALDGADAGVDGLIAKGNEAAGFVGEKTTFILLQQLLANTDLPVFAQGGIGLHSAAACFAAGASGVVLDTQLLLTRESPLSPEVKRMLAAMDGSEPRLFGQNSDSACRLHVRPGSSLFEAFRKCAIPVPAQGPACDLKTPLRLLIEKHVSWNDVKNSCRPLGQDVAIAAVLSQKHETVASVLDAFTQATAQHVEAAWNSDVLRKHAPLAKFHGTDYPIVQGPMARITDSPAFAARVAEEGGLPFVALAQLRADEIKTLLHSIAAALGGRPWGVGILGFNQADLFEEQIMALRSFSPRFAILAGGLPHQTALLESLGISAYVHVASPAILDMFLAEGVKRFIFEGSECGGHIGPRSSFVLWDTMTEKLLASPITSAKPVEYHILFAGGIHDSRSAAMVAALSAPLSQAGMRVGLLMGSAYLLTPDIVECGATVAGYQQQVLTSRDTSVLELSPGHSLRCCVTPLASRFEAKRRELIDGNVGGPEIAVCLETVIRGTSRIAAKGLARQGAFERGSKPALVEVDGKVQQEEGLYMAGQLVALHDRTRTIRELHHAVTIGASERLVQLLSPQAVPPPRQGKPCDIAIIGMACLFPQAGDLRTYWENIVNKKNAITEVPSDRWDWRLYFDEDRNAKDRIYSKWGGFMDDLVFDPTRYGLPPKSLEAIDPMQLMALEVARRTLADAGYEGRKFDREDASVILGASGGTGDVGVQYGLRSELPRFHGSLPDEVAKRLPEWTEDSFPGILLNVIAGRIANRLDLGGVNFTTDAACASSLAAIYQAVGELTTGRCSLVIAGGVDTVQGPFGYMCFSQTQALSPRGRCSAFDAGADGIVISEGIGMVALKRLEDAERNGDRIYAVIKGMGGSSDGKAKGLTAPLPAGQLRAMRRAYEQAGFGPETVSLFEAHGTGTQVGDTAELESTSGLLREAGSKPRSTAIGSVKNLIGHAKAAAGVAGLIKTALSLYHRVLPPHAGVSRPNALLEQQDSPFYLADQPLPWLKESRPRRAAVSAFGFGGTNFHTVIEEHNAGRRQEGVTRNWPSELLIWSGNREEILAGLDSAMEELEGTNKRDLYDAARRLSERYQPGAETVVIVAENPHDAANKIRSARSFLAGTTTTIPYGVYHGRSAAEPRVALLFPGQGSQYTGMSRELALYFPVYADALSEADRILSARFETRFNGMQLSHFLFPRGCYGEQAQARATKALTGTDVAQPALGAVEAGIFTLLKSFGLRPDMAGGHSYGEFAALFAAGVIDFETFLSLSEARGRFIVDSVRKGGAEFGTMAAVKAPRDYVEKNTSFLDDVIVANHNAPRQCVISGSVSGVDKALNRLSAEGVNAVKIPVAAAFHSRFVQPAQADFADVIARTVWRKPQIPVYSNTTGDRHLDDPEGIKRVMAEHMVRPVEFVAEITAMHRDGARVFLELGPKSVLTKLAGSILNDREHAAIAVDSNGGGLNAFLHAFGQLLCAGVRLNPSGLFTGRSGLRGSEEDAAAPDPKRAWLINGSRARRAVDRLKQVGVTIDEARSPDKSNGAGAEPPCTGADTTELLRLRMNARRPWGGKTDRGGCREMSTSQEPSVMGAYFDMMKQFLETQERIMSLHLGTAPNTIGPRRPGASLSRPIAPVPPDSVAGRHQATRHGDWTMLAPSPRDTQAKSGETTALKPKESAPPALLKLPVAPQPQTAAQTPVEPAKAADKRPSRDKVVSMLLGIIEAKTGYPPDMIGMNQNLEGDLGIDSIKRVEIVGALLKALPPVYSQTLGKNLGGLNNQATLSGMVDIIEKVGSDAGATVPFDSAGMGSAANALSHSFRHVMKPKHEPIGPDASKRLGHGRFIVTRDEQGVAEKLSRLLTARDCAVTLLSRDLLLDEDRLRKWCGAQATGSGPIAGVVHLAPITAEWLPADSSVETWRRQLQINEKALFILLHEFSGALASDAHVLSASSLGGLFSRQGGQTGLSIQGGGTGMLKSLSEERPDLRIKAVDLDTKQSDDAMAACLLEELELEGGRQEAGYPGGRRTVFETVAEPFPQADEQGTDPGDRIVVATAGVKGVTAELLRELARPGNTLVLTGRSALEQDDPGELKGLLTPDALRDHYVSQIRKGVMKLSPAEIRRKVKSVLAAREMRSNIEYFREQGAAVEYHAVDVTDEDSLRSLMDGIYRKHGRITDIVHGAGIIEDKLLADKKSDSWSRVVETKVLGLLLLQKHLRPDSLRSFSVMSSVAGRYGNSGQSDYATANELMNRLCCQLKRIWADRVMVKAFCWGPWGTTKFGTGMVTPEMETKFSEKGVALVTAEAGRRIFRQEILGTGRHEVEIICGEGPWEEREARIGAIRMKTGANEDGMVKHAGGNGQGGFVHVVPRLDVPALMPAVENVSALPFVKQI